MRDYLSTRHEVRTALTMWRMELYKAFERDTTQIRPDFTVDPDTGETELILVAHVLQTTEEAEAKLDEVVLNGLPDGHPGHLGEITLVVFGQ